jgi:hypothetical protein
MRWLVILTAVVAAFVFVPAASAVNVSGSIVASDPPSAGRPLTGVISNCMSAPAFPGTVDSNARSYDAFVFTNTSGSTQCVTVSITSDGTHFIMSGAYLNTFNQADLSQNYLASSNSTFSGTQGFSFNVSAGATFVLVLWEATPGAGVTSYSASVTGTGITGGAAQNRVTLGGSIGGGDPTSAGRPTTGVIPSCATSPGFPGVVNSTARHYDAYTFTNNTGVAQCMTASITSDGTRFMMGGAYNGSFNPANLAQNYIASTNATFSGTQTLRFLVPAGATFVLVLWEASPNLGVDPYSVLLNGFFTTPPTAVEVYQVRAVPAANGVRIRWRAAAGSRVVGYNVVRESGGRFTRVHSTWQTGRARVHEWLDRAEPRRRIRYWIEAVRADGSVQRYGPAVVPRR